MNIKPPKTAAASAKSLRPWIFCMLVLCIPTFYGLTSRLSHSPDTPESQQQKARLQQQIYCKTKHPESLSGVNSIRIDVQFSRTSSTSFPLHVYTDNDVVSNALIEGGWEGNILYNIIQAMKRSPDPNPIFVDVGANIGKQQYTISNLV
jgi:hypothetical protein